MNEEIEGSVAGGVLASNHPVESKGKYDKRSAVRGAVGRAAGEHLRQRGAGAEGGVIRNTVEVVVNPRGPEGAGVEDCR